MKNENREGLEEGHGEEQGERKGYYIIGLEEDWDREVEYIASKFNSDSRADEGHAARVPPYKWTAKSVNRTYEILLTLGFSKNQSKPSLLFSK